MEHSYRHTTDYIDDLKSNGKYSFRIEDLNIVLTKDNKNINKDLNRLNQKGEIYNVRRGFYIIIPDQYRNMGLVPVELFVNDLMKFIGKKYYVGLYSAAMLHGAAHQQPQEFYIINESPNIRNIKKDKLIINFSEKKSFPEYGVEEKKTDTGFIQISGKELTFLDLIFYEKSMGGLNRIISVLIELSDEMKPGLFRKVLKNDFPISVCQRAGYILEEVIGNFEIADLIKEHLSKKDFRTTLLSLSGKKSGSFDKKWKVQVNIQLESDL
ncbi:MAG: type IV toxin-antitoxin system AbiEi family antitoxin [Bacteroidales bacterium]|nr:type IV toxin-antitoxin system AbiEi family antitoxin [Bacteroidales bacterium]